MSERERKGEGEGGWERGRREGLRQKDKSSGLLRGQQLGWTGWAVVADPRGLVDHGLPDGPSDIFPASHDDGVCRAEVRRSFITTTVRLESQVTPQGCHQ